MPLYKQVFPVCNSTVKTIVAEYNGQLRNVSVTCMLVMSLSHYSEIIILSSVSVAPLATGKTSFIYYGQQPCTVDTT